MGMSFQPAMLGNTQRVCVFFHPPPRRVATPQKTGCQEQIDYLLPRWGDEPWERRNRQLCNEIMGISSRKKRFSSRKKAFSPQKHNSGLGKNSWGVNSDDCPKFGWRISKFQVDIWESMKSWHQKKDHAMIDTKTDTSWVAYFRANATTPPGPTYRPPAKIDDRASSRLKRSGRKGDVLRTSLIFHGKKHHALR